MNAISKGGEDFQNACHIDRTRMQPLPHSLTAVRAFDAAARHLSCSRAAEELFLTQSAVSKQLQSLEEDLGVQLFYRMHQGLTLTDAGAAYWAGIRPALHMLAEAAATARALRSDDNIINLIVPLSLCQKWLIPRLPHFVREHPNVKVHFAPRSAGEPAHRTFTAEIRGGRQMPPGMQGHYLFGRDLFMVCSPHLLQRAPIASPADLLVQPLFEHTRLPRLWERWFSSQRVSGYDAHGAQRFEHFSVMIPALIAGMGIALMPRCLVEDELRQGTLSLVVEQPMKTEYDYHLLCPKDRKPSAALKCFTDWLLTICADAETEGTTAELC
jgi:LysR family transcriptional regulator, glycine cleavage system transcriptional activator